MSQAAKIYSLLRDSKNLAAGQALLLGMRRAEAPYRTAILETVLDRDEPVSEMELIGEYHNFPEQWRKLILSKKDSIYSPLRTAAFSPNKQTRLNALNIIEQTQYYRLAHVVTAMLRDREDEVAEAAGGILLRLGQKLLEREKAEDAGEADGPLNETAAQRKLDRPEFLAALREAIASYPVHNRSDALRAAMYVTRADDIVVWGGVLTPTEPVGRRVRRLLLDPSEPGLAGFCVSALKNSYLRGIAGRSIAIHGNWDFVTAVARAVDEEPGDEVAKALSLIGHPSWLQAEKLPIAELKPTDQEALMGLITCLGASAEQVGECLCAFADAAQESIALRAVEAICQLGAEASEGRLRGLLKNERESVAAAALLGLLEQRCSSLRRIMAEQLASPHKKVRDLAERYFRDIAFGTYWNRFDELSSEMQEQSSKVVFKIDPGAQEKLRRCAQHGNADNRLRAVRIARLAGRVEESLEFVMELSEDEHPMVRSCAVAALGDVKVEGKDATYHRLVGALSDRDSRVQANAIEALELRGQAEFDEKITKLMNSPSSRVRANAIKTQLHCRVYSSRRAINAMLADRRAPHRISAKWLVEHIHKENEHRKEANHEVAVV